jgi:DNA-3-methyladenine glycosylase
VKSPIWKAAPAPSSNSVPPHRRLTRADLPAETFALARYLIGKLLMHRLGDGTILAGRIVETEAYGTGDPSSHAYRGLSKRNRAMFAAHAHVYIYLIYGTSYCLNISTEAPGVGAAVLIRAAEPLAGIDRMRALRARPALRDDELARGPGNLCRAFGIGPPLDGLDLETSAELTLGDDGTVCEIGTSVRIGLTKAADWEHRYYARGSRAVSGRRSLSP